MNLSKTVKPIRIMNAQAAGTANVNSSVIDMQGFEGAVFILSFGTITATAVSGLKLQQGDKADGSDMADIAGTALAMADTGSNKVLVSDLYKPQKRYVRLVATRGTANAVIDSAIAIQYEARITPPALDSSVYAAEFNISPDNGVA
jgi:hypothetical protein